MSTHVAQTLQLARRAGDLVVSVGKSTRDSLLDLVLPPACRLCLEPIDSGDFCQPCESMLTLSESQMETACPKCGVPRPDPAGSRKRGVSSPAIQVAGLDSPAIRDSPAGLESSGLVEDPGDSLVGICPHCRSRRFQFDRVVALWAYQDAVCDAVVAAKYAHRVALADALGRRLGRRISRELAGQLPDVVTYLPSHLTRQLSRGGNAAEAIARAVSRQISRPCRPLLRINRRIAKQAWLDDDQRRKNVRGAFSPRKSYALLSGLRRPKRHVLLVDDVLTTGSTADEATAALREIQAVTVTLAVVARALRS